MPKSICTRSTLLRLMTRRFIIALVFVLACGLAALMGWLFFVPTQIANQPPRAALPSEVISERCDHLINEIPVIIEKPGRWCMTKNIDSSNLEHDGIIINTNDVVIDGLNHHLTGPTLRDTQSRGIIGYDRSRVIIKNITITGFNTSVLFAHTANMASDKGFHVSNKSSGITLKNVQIYNPKFHGIYVNADNFRIEHSSVYGVGPATEKSHSFVTGIYAVGNLCEISNNQILLGRPTGNGESVGISIYYGNGCRIANNRITFDIWPEWGENYGIWVKGDKGSLPLVENNVITSSSYALGPYGAFKNNIALNTSCSLFVKRKSEESRIADLGGNSNIARESKRDPTLGNGGCKNNPKKMEARYFLSPNMWSAFAVSRSYQENPQGPDVAKILAWQFIAACHGHELAKPVAADPTAHADKKNDIELARKLAARTSVCQESNLRKR